ncbi:MAG: hypothetical protein IJG65_04515 [Synergistaceae bacterium]|nr:hypothetical protein [Synergistaceae bacterium]
MKKLTGIAYLVVLSLSLFSLSGCSGGGASSSSSEPTSGYEVRQIVVLSSPALELNKRYSIYTGGSLSHMEGSRYYIASTGSEENQAVLNLGLSEELDPNVPFIVVNDETGSGDRSVVVFAYDPSGVNSTPKNGGTVTFTGGRRLRYRTLNLRGTEPRNVEDYPNDYIGHDRRIRIISRDNNVRPVDADIYASFTTERGTTEFATGLGDSVSFLVPDEDYYLSRDIAPSGYVFRLVRQVNSFSGITRN